jgi:hypothetical protein
MPPAAEARLPSQTIPNDAEDDSEESDEYDISVGDNDLSFFFFKSGQHGIW